VQKWDDNLCPKVEDYNIFFATMRKSGKDNSGEKIYRKVTVNPLSNSENRSPLTLLTKGGIDDNNLEKSPPCQDEDLQKSPPCQDEDLQKSPPFQNEDLQKSPPFQNEDSQKSPPFQGGLGGFLLDNHGHLIVEHDLFNHDGLTEDGIAEAFMEFAKKEGLSFFDLSLSINSFDAVKYHALMDRLEATEVKLSNLERTKRIDSEFFKKEYINIDFLLAQKQLISITKYVKVFDGNHMKISDNFSNTGIPYYRGQDIHNFFIEQSSPICIDIDTYNLPYMKRSHLRKGDVLLSIVGTIGNVSLVDSEKPTTCNCKLAIQLHIR
jgi:hypothetical protein